MSGGWYWYAFPFADSLYDALCQSLQTNHLALARGEDQKPDNVTGNAACGCRRIHGKTRLA
eukprot:3399043-Pleurochrysis_carterae.AAC.1